MVAPPRQSVTGPAPVSSPERQAYITVSGNLFNGERKSQDILVKFRDGKTIGEIIWTTIEIVKRVGGLVEEINNEIMYYPLDAFDGGLKFVEKKMLSTEAQ